MGRGEVVVAVTGHITHATAGDRGFARAEIEDFAPDLVSMTFAGLRSSMDDSLLMRQRRGHRRSVARNRNRFAHREAVGSPDPRASLSASVSPSSNSMTRYAVPACVPTSCKVQMFGMRELRDRAASR